MSFSHLADSEFPLKSTEAELQAFVLEHEPNLVFIKDEQYRILHANKAFLNILLEEVRFNLSAAIEAADMDHHTARLPVATVEPNLLRQLFQNLIENSIKHPPPNGWS